MPQTRRLAAIMFTDIVNYSALMGDDESFAFELLNQNRLLQKPLIEKFDGQWIKELGDGVLASFNTVTDAVKCACAIIKGCDPIAGLQLRIGIHQSEVIFENDDVFGDGVNIAARIMSLAEPGGICISDAVRDNVANNKQIVTSFLREETLKHIKEPMRIYGVVIDVKPAKTETNVPDQTVIAKSIAVLPFVNMSNDPEQEYFSDGMAEEILTSLSALKDLKVAGRRSSFQFKGRNIDLREVGGKLGVSNVLEGSVRKQGNRLRVSAQLINVADGFSLWSERFDRDMDDIFAIQDEIATAITEALKIILVDKEKAALKKIPTENKEAYDLYLKGRFYLAKRGASVHKALGYFNEAVAADPEFALGYAGIADTYTILAFFSILSPHDAILSAKEAARKSIALDDTLVEPLTALAFAGFQYDWDWPGVKRIFDDAFKLNPNYALLYTWYSLYVILIENDYEKALSVASKGSGLEPLAAARYIQIAIVHIAAGKYDMAIQPVETAIELNENYFLGYWARGIIQLGLNNYEASLKDMQKSLDLSARHPWALWAICYAYYATGETDKIEEIYKELKQRAESSYISSLILCVIANLLKLHKEAFKYLDLAFEERDPNLLAWRRYPFIDMTNEPLFQSYLARMKFPG